MPRRRRSRAERPSQVTADSSSGRARPGPTSPDAPAGRHRRPSAAWGGGAGRSRRLLTWWRPAAAAAERGTSRGGRADGGRAARARCAAPQRPLSAAITGPQLTRSGGGGGAPATLARTGPPPTFPAWRRPAGPPLSAGRHVGCGAAALPCPSSASGEPRSPIFPWKLFFFPSQFCRFDLPGRSRRVLYAEPRVLVQAQSLAMLIKRSADVGIPKAAAAETRAPLFSHLCS